ncbi:MAG TPA: hypothetical protein PJ982_08450, partial [Lacipirellulaceae bacterium]|nr:hypothetical protein [Lacipirellulaceae bacterium]
MFGTSQFQVRAYRSFVDLLYRLVDAAAILMAAAAAIDLTDSGRLHSLAVVGATTLLVHLVAIEVSGLYRNWRGSRLSFELWTVLVNWIYTAPAVLGIGLVTQYNAEFSYAAKLAWLTLTPLTMGSARIVLRIILRNLRKRGFNTRKFAICGVNKLALQLAGNVQNSPELGLEVVGYFD